MVKIIFDKMHGCGNDFVIIDQRTSYTNIEPRHIKKLANRRTGIGFDQLILINGSSVADCGIEIYNQDGSLAMACGNATRCVAWLTNATTIETASGILSSEVKKNGPVKISMGNPVIHDHEILLEGLELITKPVSISMGNPHLILIVKDINNMDLVEIA